MLLPFLLALSSPVDDHADAFAAADEVCVGEGDFAASLARARSAGWTEFEPESGSMMAALRAAWLDGDEFSPAQIALLRKDGSGAEIILFQTMTIFRDYYIHHCNVHDERASNLNEGAVRAWANGEVKTRQVDDSPIYFDVMGPRFANDIGGKATAYFIDAPESERWPTRGFVLAFGRTNLPSEGDE